MCELDLSRSSKASVQIEFNRPAAVDALDEDSETEDN